MKLLAKFLLLMVVGTPINFVSTTGEAAPSFDCRKASTQVENMICDSPRLAALDSELADAYRTALRDSPWASANRRIRSAQTAWIARRNQCQSSRCLSQTYHDRIGELYAEVGDPAMGAEPPKADPASMMAVCRDRAAHVFHLRLPNVETKYEGSASIVRTPLMAPPICARWKKRFSVRLALMATKLFSLSSTDLGNRVVK
jgi:uncharacterized protein YecT (DUF1311 family)